MWYLDKSINLILTPENKTSDCWWETLLRTLRAGWLSPLCWPPSSPLIGCQFPGQSDLQHSNLQKPPRGPRVNFLSSDSGLVKKLNRNCGARYHCHVEWCGVMSLIREFIDPDHSMQQCRLLWVIDSFNYRFFLFLVFKIFSLQEWKLFWFILAECHLKIDKSCC